MNQRVPPLAAPATALMLALLLTVYCYWGGLNGPFLFDDYPNLQSLGTLGGVRDWPTFNAYLHSGWSGPLGRHLSMLSFLLDDNTWPSQPGWFKPTSLKLHLITGLLLAWATFLVVATTGRSAVRSAWISVFSASVWMLHPLMVSTTLYIVQRMALLCGLFMLVGLIGYLKGRKWLSEPQRPAWQAYGMMTASAGGGTLLALLAKENGALLPMLMLVVEAFLRRVSQDVAPRKIWMAVVLGIPAAVVVVYLARLLNFDPNVWPTRPFNRLERLYSEARIVWDYLRSLWIPHIEGSGLYQDGFKISRSLTEPISTLWAVVGMMAVVASLPLLYRRLPYVWLALAFYLVGHLTESTVVGLELVFEHRNYAPAFFMFLPLAVGLERFGQLFGKPLAVLCGLAVLAMLAFLTWNRAQLWSDRDRLQAYWAAVSPDSARGQNFILTKLVVRKHYDEALARSQEAIERIPDSALLTMSWLQIRVNTKQAKPEDFVTAGERLAKQPFDAQAVTGIRVLTADIARIEELAEYRKPMLGLLEYLKEHGMYRTLAMFNRFVPYAEGQLYASLGARQQAFEQYLDAMNRYRQSDAAMQMFSELANAGYLVESSKLLDHIDESIKAGRFDSAPLGQEHYLGEIERLRKELAQMISSRADR